VNFWNDDASTELYLVRIWRRKPGDIRPALHGKLQHAVSGASSYFDELSALPDALVTMMDQQTTPFGSPEGNFANDGRDDEARRDEQQEQGG
jgi:hypothetical protein